MGMTTRKLALNKETVRLLTESESNTVVGGTTLTPVDDGFGFLSRWGSECDPYYMHPDNTSVFICIRF
jgi:hypothetical protein